MELRGLTQNRCGSGVDEGIIDGADRRSLIDAPTFVISADGAVWLANDSANRMLASDGEMLRRMMVSLVKRGAAHRAQAGRVTEIVSAHGERAFLVVLASDERVGCSPLRAAIERWRLTDREAEVVEFIAEGEANKAIAALLDVSTRTIEVHVTSVLRKATVDSRARLIASFWKQT